MASSLAASSRVVALKPAAPCSSRKVVSARAGKAWSLSKPQQKISLKPGGCPKLPQPFCQREIPYVLSCAAAAAAPPVATANSSPALDWALVAVRGVQHLVAPGDSLALSADDCQVGF
jgi:hypothetical protein